jgi:molybdate transport system substrate-binding protein
VRNRLLGSILIAALVTAGCAGGGTPSGAARSPDGAVASPSSASSSASSSAAAGPTSTAVTPVEITVFAASSLTEAFDALAAAYEAADPGVTVTLSYDSSAALRAKIEQGARVDVFASADTKNPDALVSAGLAAGPTTPFTANELAVIVPSSNPAGLVDPYGLAEPGVKVIAAGENVPITGYATKLLENLEAYRGAQADLIPSYERNIVSREDNVKGVVAKVELGEGDGGIVYATDAKGAGDGVLTLPIPPGTNVRATYGAVIPSDAPEPVAAADFLAWLAGPAARGILASFGFAAP